MKHLLYLIFLVFSWNSLSQEAISWQTQARKTDSLSYDIVLKATIEPHWHLYGINMPEFGPLPTQFEFENVELINDVQHSEIITAYDPIFEMELNYFDDYAEFYQSIKLKNPDDTFVNIKVTYQACDDKVCIFREETLKVSLSGSYDQQPKEDLTSFDDKTTYSLKLALKNTELLTATSESDPTADGYWTVFLLGFLGGLIAILTPCVFPMIPLTVSFFTKQSSDRKQGLSHAVLYGFFIVLIYLLLSIPFHFLDSVNPELLNTISTNMWLNVFFFLIFMFFAFSFFGYYELTLPASWANKIDFASNKSGGIIGIFLMALTLAIVSFSCTGPILGSLLVGSLSAEGGAVQLSMGMTGFGLALALPFALFAWFPNALTLIPKSGQWMNTIKVVLGFLELALALKFLSNADLVSHWGILKREILLGLWAMIFLALALYLFGVYRFPHETKEKISKGRYGFAFLSFAFMVYLLSGVLPYQNTNLSLLAGFPPPTFYSIYAQNSDCPLGLDCYKDFEDGRIVAALQNKPILLDFTGWACVNCRKVEENVWSDPEIFKLINENFVLISLYVDDRKALPDNEIFDITYASGRVRTIETVGQKWAAFQAINFQSVAQPHYILMMPDGTILAPAQQYTDIVTYKLWLKQGLKNVPIQSSELSWEYEPEK